MSEKKCKHSIKEIRRAIKEYIGPLPKLSKADSERLFKRVMGRLKNHD